MVLSLRATASTLSTQTLVLSAVLVQVYVLLALLTLNNQKKTISSSFFGNCLFFCPLFAAARANYEGIAVCTLGNSRIVLVSAYRDTVERAVMLGYQVVSALRNIALNAFVFLLIFHDKISVLIIGFALNR